MSKKPSEFSHHIRREGNVVIVALRGHLDGFAAMELKPAIDELLSGGAMFVVFACRELSYTGLIGYRVVLTTAKKLQRRKGRFAMCGLAPGLKEIFQLAGRMNPDIPIFDSLDEALAAIRNDCK
ncbi:MAG: STAS domain-containing protein [Acidobacteriota bacterium]|nr:STAS domain-containing protein [Acidobacteriota bacterium]